MALTPFELLVTVLLTSVVTATLIAFGHALTNERSSVTATPPLQVMSVPVPPAPTLPSPTSVPNSASLWRALAALPVHVRALDTPCAHGADPAWAVAKNPRHTVTIGVVGKYVHLSDTYKSLNEALEHGGFANNTRVNLVYVDADALMQDDDQAPHFSGRSPTRNSVRQRLL